MGGVRRARLAVALAVGTAGVLMASLLAAPVASRAAVSGSLEGIPHYDHVITIVLENQNYNTTWNTPGLDGQPTYLQNLRAQGAFADEYFGISHVSADNYIAMTSGQPATPLFNTDCLPSWAACETFEKAWPDGGRSIADQVEANGQTWKAYMDAMSGTCEHPPATAVPDPDQTGYATRHDPFVYYPPIADDQARCDSHVVPYTQLATDLASGSFPNYVFITPDTCHDGHDAPCTAPPAEAGQPGGLTSANEWLASEVPKITTSPAFTTSNSLLIITFDENGFSDVQGCCGAIAAGGNVTTSDVALGGRIGLVAIGAGITPGTLTHITYDHWSYLRTVEDALGISEYLNLAGLPTTSAMTGLFGS